MTTINDDFYSILKETWDFIEDSYKKEEINSERYLQALLFSTLKIKMPSLKINVEPKVIGPQSQFDGNIKHLERLRPDLVIVDENKNEKSIKAFIEIKYVPHWWLEQDALEKDLRKLIQYSKACDIGLDSFGPNRIFTNKEWYRQVSGKWIINRDRYVIDEETWYCFAVITRYNKFKEDFKNFYENNPEIKDLNRFCLMLGAIEINDRPNEFHSVQYFDTIAQPVNEKLLPFNEFPRK